MTSSGAPPKGLPELLISPQYHAQQRRNYHFGAIFVVPGPDVQFKDTFTGEYDVVALENATDQSLGCTPASGSISELINWDVTTTVSESYVSVGGPVHRLACQRRLRINQGQLFAPVDAAL